MLKHKKLMFLFVILFVLVIFVGIAKANDSQGKNIEKAKIERGTLLLTIGASIMIAITLGGVYAQILNHLIEKYYELRDDKKVGPEPLRKIRLVIGFLTWQIACFFILIFALFFKLWEFPEFAGRFVFWPLVISQVLHVITYSYSYGKFLRFREP